MVKFLEHRIQDPNIIRLIKRMLKAGIMDNGVGYETEEGTPQGGIASPILGTIYLHYVIDLWFEKRIKKQARGAAYMVRYADDNVFCFQYEDEAREFYAVLVERLKQFALDISAEKSKIIAFGRNAGKKRNDNGDNERKKGGRGKPETFDFLGFTHYCSTGKNGKFRVKRKTSAKKYRASLLRAKLWIKDNRHAQKDALMAALSRKLIGYYQYYGIAENRKMISKAENRIPTPTYRSGSLKRLDKWSEYMETLMAVQDYAQQIAEAVATVVKIDVEITDDHMVRVAGTGRYRSGVGQSMYTEGYVYREVLRTGKQFVVDEPGNHELCRPCKYFSNCLEKYEVVSPINVDGRTVGIIGLLCFTDEQAEIIYENPDSYLTFLTKMAETIALKLKEEEYLKGLLSSNRYLHSIIDCLEEGLLTVDEEGYIEHCNPIAKRLFLPTVIQKGTHLTILFSQKTVTDILAVTLNGKERPDYEASVRPNQVKQQLFLRARPIVTDNGICGVVLTIRPLDEISRIVNRHSTHEANCTVHDILGISKIIRGTRERAEIVAVSNSTVLIRGESGTGKEMLARAIHNLSPRKHGPFIAINCSAIPETLLESELFGFEEGAFTGARKGGKLGKVELANNGTLFLDEIGDMPLFLQAKILRVLQERQVERVGAMQPNPVDVRVIAATHRNLEEMMAQGEFRADLYYRINVIPIVIAPLRERKEDIEVLLKHFIQVYNELLNKSVQKVSQEFKEQLYEYSWPGNVRELQNVMEYTMNLAEGPILTEELLPIKLRNVQGEAQLSHYNLESMESEMIRRCLDEFGTTVQGKERAARALGIGIATLYRKLARFNL